MGMLFVTHNLGVVAEIAHRVAVMYAGRIVEDRAGRARCSRNPRHPYTIGLMRSMPKLGEATRLKAAGDEARRPSPAWCPSLARPARRLRLRPALPAAPSTPAAPPCRRSIDVGAGHRSRCIRWQEL